MANYFITGIGGFIGLELCKHLIEQGHTVTGLVHKNIPPELAGYPVRLIQADLLEPHLYAAALHECEVLVHLAGNPKFGNGKQYEVENVTTTKALLDVAASDAGKLQRFIFVSTIGAIDRAAADGCEKPLDEAQDAFPSSDYGKSKLKCEGQISRSGLPYTILRPTLVVGGKMRFGSHVAVFSRQAIQRKLFSRLNWPGEISVIHVADLAKSIIAVAESEQATNQVYFAAGETISIGQIMRMANPSLRQIPLDWFASMLKPLVRFIPFSIKALLYPALTASDSKLQHTGWRCTVSLDEALQEVIAREKSRVVAKAAPGGWCLISGAASGLGSELAKLLHAHGRKLILVDRNEEGLQHLLPDAKDVLRISTDLSDWAATRTKLETALPAQPEHQITELFLCAGFGLRGEINRLSGSAQAGMFHVNVLSRLQLAKQALPQMITNQFGRIVYVSSSSAYQPLPYMGVYAASNAAVLLMGEALAYENRDNGIEVLTVCPGGMSTNFQKAAGVKEIEGEKLMSPQRAAQIIVNSLGKNRIVIMPGFRSFAMSLAARVLPRKLSLYLWGKLMAMAR